MHHIQHRGARGAPRRHRDAPHGRARARLTRARGLAGAHHPLSALLRALGRPRVRAARRHRPVLPRRAARLAATRGHHGAAAHPGHRHPQSAHSGLGPTLHKCRRCPSSNNSSSSSSSSGHSSHNSEHTVDGHNGRDRPGLHRRSAAQHPGRAAHPAAHRATSGRSNSGSSSSSTTISCDCRWR